VTGVQTCALPITKERYFEVRDNSTAASRAARAAWLNLMSFNGLWRKNKAGRFNMPPDPSRLAKPPVDRWSAKVAHASSFLEAVSFERSDVVDSLRKVSAGDAAYVDTPYLPEAATKTSFVGYTDSRDWRQLAAHKAVVEAARGAVERGGRVAISNSASARQLYVDVLGNLPDFRVIEVSNRRSVNSKGNERAVVPEILVVVG
jgi:DNA adenine methylase